MNVTDVMPEPASRMLFTLSNCKTILSSAGCYILTTFDGEILYVGLSINLNKRFKEHLGNPEKISPTPDGKAFWFYFSSYDKGNLNKLERTWLNQYQTAKGRRPILNKTDSPVS